MPLQETSMFKKKTLVMILNVLNILSGANIGNKAAKSCLIYTITREQPQAWSFFSFLYDRD